LTALLKALISLFIVFLMKHLSHVEMIFVFGLNALSPDIPRYLNFLIKHHGKIILTRLFLVVILIVIDLLLCHVVIVWVEIDRLVARGHMPSEIGTRPVNPLARNNTPIVIIIWGRSLFCVVLVVL
jgi:hypothetical protein